MGACLRVEVTIRRFDCGTCSKKPAFGSFAGIQRGSDRLCLVLMGTVLRVEAKIRPSVCGIDRPDNAWPAFKGIWAVCVLWRSMRWARFLRVGAMIRRFAFGTLHREYANMFSEATKDQ